MLYVIEQEVHPGYHETWKESVNQDVPEIEAEARKSLVGALGEEALEGTELCVVVGTGDGKAHREISRFAEEQESDLVVMGTLGVGQGNAKSIVASDQVHLVGEVKSRKRRPFHVELPAFGMQ